MNHWKCTLPEGQRGQVAIVRFAVSVADSQLTALRREYVPSGEYTRLEVDGQLVMSDTPKERTDHLDLFWRAKGHVLLNGLGLGCCLNVVLHNPEVERVTVIEKDADVVELVGQHFPQVEIICADALEWKPPRDIRYGAVWHDIWANVCLDNLPEMHHLHRKYGRKTDWQGSWSRNELNSIARKEKP